MNANCDMLGVSRVACLHMGEDNFIIKGFHMVLHRGLLRFKQLSDYVSP